MELSWSHLGYLAVLLGTFFEGETILVLGGLAAHQGYLKLSGVIACAFIGGLAGDQVAFWIGRNRGKAILEKRPAWRARGERVTALLERYQIAIAFGFRFLYGMRILVPVVAGASRMSLARFAALNATGTLVWAVAVGSGGYFFGMALRTLMGDLKRYELIIFGVGLTIALVVYALRRHRERGHDRRP